MDYETQEPRHSLEGLVIAFLDCAGIRPDTVSPEHVELYEKLLREECLELLDAKGPVNALKESCDVGYICACLNVILSWLQVRNSGFSFDGFSPATEILLRVAREGIQLVRDTMGRPVLEEAMRRVHASNMLKFQNAKGFTWKRSGEESLQKVDKGPRYEPPHLDDLVSSWKAGIEDDDRPLFVSKAFDSDSVH